MKALTPQNAPHLPAQTPAPRKPIKPLVSLRAHKNVALILFALFALLGLPLAWIKGTPIYYTEASVYVAPRFIKNLTEDVEQQFQSNSQYRQYVEQQVRTIPRYDILQAAIKQIDSVYIKQHLIAETEQRTIYNLAGMLQLKPVLDTYLITIGIESARPEGLSNIVNTVVNTYLEKQRVEEFYASDERITNLQQERERLLKIVDDLVEKRIEIAQEIGVTAFNESFVNPFDKILGTNREALNVARQRRIEAEANLASVDKTQRKEGNLALQAQARDRVDMDSGLNSLKQNLFDRRSRLLEKISGLGPNHPGRIAIQREINEIETEFNRATNELNQSHQETLIEQYRAAVYETRRIENELEKDLEEQAQKAKWFAKGYQEALSLGNSIEKERGRLLTIEERVDFLALESKAPGFVRLASLAPSPELPVRGGRKKMYLIILFAGVALSLVVPTAIDMLDPRIHTPIDVASTLGISTMGWIIERSNQMATDFSQDQLKRLVANMDRDRRTHQTKSFLITSVKPGGWGDENRPN